MSAWKNIAIGLVSCVWVSAVSLTLMLYVYNAPAKGEETQQEEKVQNESSNTEESTLYLTMPSDREAWSTDTYPPCPSTGTEQPVTEEY